MANTTAQDLTGYLYLRMLVHGDLNADSLTRMYLRFGQDSLNHYYYSDVVRPGWIGNGVEVDFDRITVLKQKTILDSTALDSNGRVDVFDTAQHIGVKGLPSLSRVSYMEIGVLRTGALGDSASSGEIWCDELRLEGVRRDVGTAARIKLTTQMADLLGFTANVDVQNYAFRTLNQGRSGSVLNSSSQLKTAAYGNILLSKFIPQSWGLSLPVSLTYSQDVSTPKLLTGSDVVLDKELQQKQQSVNISDGASTSIRWVPPTKNWLLNSTLGALSGTFSVNRQRGWSPTTPYRRSESYSAGATYALRFPHRLTFPPLYWMRFLLMPRSLYNTRFSLLPTEFSAAGNVSRSKSYTENNKGVGTPVYNRSFDGNSRLGLSPIPSVTVSYNMTTRRDLSNPEEINLTLDPKRFRLGREQRFTQRFSADYKPSLFSFLTHSFGYSADFNDQIDNTYFNHDVRVSRAWSATGTFDVARFWGFLGYVEPKAKPRAPTPKKTDTKKPGDKNADTRKGGQKDLEEGPKGGAKDGSGREEEPPPGRHKDDAQPAGPQPENQGLTGDAAQQAKTGVYGPPTPDSTKKERPSAKGGGGFGPFDAWRAFLGGLDWITTPIGPLSVSFQHNEGDNQVTSKRPNWRYQFGLSESTGTGPAVGSISAASVAAKTKSDNLGIKNQLKFANILTFSNSYSLSLSRRIQGASVNRSKSLTFPALATSLDRLERFKPIGWFLTGVSARFGFNQKIDSAWTGSTASRTKTTSFSPLLNLTGTIKKTIRFGFTVDQNKTETSSQLAGINPTERTSRSWRLNADYSFSSPKGIPLPFLRGIRLKSQMSISVVVSGRSGEAYDFIRKPDSTIERRQTQTSSDFTVTPTANYSFSTRVRGGFTAQWSDIMDNSSGGLGRRKSHIRSLGIWAEFSF
jgi:cell surface protein SprA